MNDVLSNIEKLTDGNEAIYFQYGRSFPKEIDALCEHMMLWGEEYTRVNGPANRPAFHIAKMKAGKKEFEKNVSDKLNAAIKKYTGISNLRITVLDEVGQLVYAMTLHRSDIISSDRDITRGKEADIKSIKDVIKAIKSLDKRKGKFVESTMKKFEFELFLPLAGFWIAETTMVIKPLTAQEITAVILHEIGHMITLIDIAAAGVSNNDFGTIDREVIEKGLMSSKKELVSLIKRASSYASKGSTQKEIGDKIVHVIEKEDIEPGIITRVLALMIQTFLSTLMVSLSSSATLVYTTLLMKTSNYYELVLSIMYDSSDSRSKGKSTAMRKTSHLERVADEFVAKYGYAKYLNIALDKITRISSHSVFTHVGVDTRSTSILSVLGFINSFVPAFMLAMLAMSVKTTSYEDLNTRMQRNIQNTRASLKDTALPKDIRDRLLRDMDDIERDMKQFNRSFFGSMIAINSFLYQVANIDVAAFRRLILSNPRQFDILQEQFDALQSNTLYVSSARMSRIFD